MAEISRRALLSRTVLVAGVAVGAGLGLTRRVHHKVAVPPPAPPAALTDALARQQRLLADHDAVASGHHPGRPTAAGLRSDVVAHGDALRALLELYPGWRLARAGSSSSGAAPSPTATGMSVKQLAAATAGDARALTDAALAWPATEQHAVEVVPVLGSIAACLASQAQELAG
jgi:hypothetical protein